MALLRNLSPGTALLDGVSGRLWAGISVGTPGIRLHTARLHQRRNHLFQRRGEKLDHATAANVRIIFLSLSLFLIGCATSTLEKRKAEKRVSYERLAPEFKAFVDEGQIQTGMTEDAVYMAWGKPAEILIIEDLSKHAYGPNQIVKSIAEIKDHLFDKESVPV